MQIVTTNVIQGKAHDNGDHITNKIPDFHSNHNIGNHVQISQQTFILSLSQQIFLKFVFTIDLVKPVLCQKCAYAWKNISNKQSYANRQGAWTETNSKEIMKSVASYLPKTK